MIEFLHSRFSSSILKNQFLGKSDKRVIWIEKAKLIELASALKEEVSLGLALEFLSVFELDQTLVFSYFFRPHRGASGGILRFTQDLTQNDVKVEVPSVAGVWSEAEQYESEASELFGITFLSQAGERLVSVSPLLPPEWAGYPLRKNYLFPAEYSGIPHMRPAQRAVPDEFGAGG